MPRRAYVCLLAIAVVLGCGGGGSVVSKDPGQTITNGSVQVQGSDLVQTVSTQSNSTFYGIAGNINTATYFDLTPTDGECEIYYTSLLPNSATWTLKAVSPILDANTTFTDGSVRTIRDSISGPIVDMRINPAGTDAFLCISVPAQSTIKLYRYPLNGGPRVLINPSCRSFAFTPSGSKIIYIDNETGQIWKMNADGTSRSSISPSISFTRVIGCLDEDIVRVADSSPSVTLADFRISDGSFTTTNTVDYTLSYAAIGRAPNATWGRVVQGGDPYLFRASTRSINKESCTVFWNDPILNFSTDVYPAPSGNRAAFGLSGGNPSVQITDGTSNTLLVGEQLVGQVCWGPNVQQRQFVGRPQFADGMGAILFSETSDRLPAVVLADAVTRSTIQLTKVSDGSAKNTVYQLSCDNLWLLAFADTISYQMKAVVTGSSGLSGAFVSFDGDTGKLYSIVTYSGTPNVASTPGGVEVKGELNEVYGALRKASGRVGATKL